MIKWFGLMKLLALLQDTAKSRTAYMKILLDKMRLFLKYLT